MAPRRPLLAPYGCLLALLVAADWAAAETVVLQEGQGGYKGCSTATFWGPKATRPASDPPAALYLRGTHTHLLLWFKLPPARASQKLARARLEVFIPSVKNLRMICEILCREVQQPWGAEADWSRAARGEPWRTPGGTFDETTDYQRGRPPGVLDSFSLWEYDGQYFPHRYRHLGVPEGGRWIDFNVTPAVRKWLADPRGNFGVVLQGVALGDKRFPNTAEIDIPSERNADAAKRPRLVLDFEPLEKPYLVGVTHTLERICDRDTRFRYTGPFEERYELAMARNEFEGFQLVVYPMAGPLEGVTFEWTDLVDAQSGAKIPKEDISYHLQEVFKLHPNGKTGDWYFHGKRFDLPDPLIWAKPADLPVHMSTPFWFTVHTRPETKAGTYRGTITVQPKNAPPRPVELTVKVWNYAIPEKWNFETMGQTIWGNISRAYGKLTPEMKRKYLDFLLDHRFSPVEQYINVLSPNLEDIPYCMSRGMSTIYLSGNFKVSPENVESLKKRYDAVKQLGFIDQSLVYIGDETKDWAEMRRRSDAIRKACPELLIMIGGSFPRKELEGIIDVFDPQIDVGRGNQVYSVNAKEIQPLIAKAQGRGEKFFWYVAAGPMLPCPNVQMEEPLIASRLLFWMTWKFGVTGFEYYCYNIWSHNFPGKDGKRWPDKPFYPRGWGDTNGDGMLFYPGPDGPFSSVRFENIRDGIEDWESHYVLRDYVDALRANPALAEKSGPLLARAEAVLKVPDEVCKLDFVNWTWEPAVLLKAHRELGDTIDELAKRVPEGDMLALRSARKKAELDRQRAMLKARAEAAK